MVSPPFCLYTVLSLGILGTLALETIHREGDLHVANRKIAPDGWKRSAVLAGKSLATVDIPGPLITANRGDRLKINVIDELSDTSMVRATSIHWHGIFQKGTNWADGVASVTQCPIIPGESFLYNFLVPEPGTYWYHSHISVQYCDGLRGPLVIYDPEDPYKGEYDVDDESTVLTIADWYHRTARDILATQAAPAPNATLINGKGRYPENPTAPFSVINVEHGKRYRFRLISMSCDPSHTFSIDGHNFTIIETDGQYTQPHTVTSIFLHAGQRYSIILHANQKIGNYWIRASPDDGPVGYENGINSAILRYSGSPPSEPQPSTHPTPTGPGSELKEYDLAPLFSPQAPGRPRPGGADVTLDITLGFALPASFLMNGVQWKTPSVPVLLQMLSGQRHPKSLVPNGLVYLIPKGAIVEVNLHGGDAPGGPHPFHLHGHAFSVVKHGDIDVYNFQNPVRRDVTYVSTGNLTTIRFTTNNTGPWFLHCHKDFHLEDGLAAVLAEDIEDVKEEVVPPDEWKNLCPTYEEFSQTYPADSP
ncbi:hypothetical protein E1B28_008025 [Marasmius oreades]|uniref:Laccase n=1 Tax=Marasmius oreades TaxID=181124 RepID=A0A9P7S361_9AGAR|nr:uncharacterized protein E1B28_008025 [Marasmius oreades]KAG7094425.1 hypothetical protein E1B28_008025 [Marasmius oreades]